MAAGNKKDEAPRKKTRIPSSGEGADSALDALKKMRVPPPAPQPSSPPRRKG